MMKKQHTLAADLAKTSGVAEKDVVKVLEELGLSRALVEVDRLSQGHVVDKASVRLAVRVGRTMIMM